MKKVGIGIFFTLFSLTFTQTYCTGDQISLEHQNSPLVVGAGFEDYSEGDNLYLSDFNSDSNVNIQDVILVINSILN